MGAQTGFEETPAVRPRESVWVCLTPEMADTLIRWAEDYIQELRETIGVGHPHTRDFEELLQHLHENRTPDRT